MSDVVQLVDVRSAFVASLTASCSVPVYRSATPVGHDSTRPWIVVEWPPGGQPIGSAIAPDQMREVLVRIRAVAVDPDAASGPAPAAEDAAQWAADQAAAWFAAPPHVGGDAWVICGGRRVSSAGIDREGNTVNVVDDYTLVIGPA